MSTMTIYDAASALDDSHFYNNIDDQDDVYARMRSSNLVAIYSENDDGDVGTFRIRGAATADNVGDHDGVVFLGADGAVGDDDGDGYEYEDRIRRILVSLNTRAVEVRMEVKDRVVSISTLDVPYASFDILVDDEDAEVDDEVDDEEEMPTKVGMRGIVVSLSDVLDFMSQGKTATTVPTMAPPPAPVQVSLTVVENSSHVDEICHAIRRWVNSGDADEALRRISDEAVAYATRRSLGLVK